MENGELGVGNWEWGMGNGEWETIQNLEFRIIYLPHLLNLPNLSLIPTPHSLLPIPINFSAVISPVGKLL
jgi:hypothetical protein